MRSFNLNANLRKRSARLWVKFLLAIEYPLNSVDDLGLLPVNITALIDFWCLLVEYLAKTIWFTFKDERYLLNHQISYTKVNIITIITCKQLIITWLWWDRLI